MRRLGLLVLLALPAAAAAQAATPGRFSPVHIDLAHAPGVSSPRNRAASLEAPPIGAAQTADPWFAPDKVKHFFTSAALQSLAYGALRAADAEHGPAIAGASIVTAAFGIGKELSDRSKGRPFSVPDLVWDAAGAVAASLLLQRTER
jgi:uncharacterized protein YfiM (DUF2279 family)